MSDVAIDRPKEIVLPTGRLRKRARLAGDKLYKIVLQIAAAVVLLVIIGLLYELINGSADSISTFGFDFLIGSTWNPGDQKFGALPFKIGRAHV